MADRRGLWITWSGTLGLLAAAGLIVVLLFWFQEDVAEWGTNPVAANIPDGPAAINAGGALYQDRCAACHGSGLQGHEAPKASAEPWHTPHPLVSLLGDVGARPPAAPIGMASQDPAIKDLSDEEMLNLAGFIRSRWPAPREQSRGTPAPTL